MLTLLERVEPNPQGTINFLYHDDCNMPLPGDFSDPLILLGDISLLQLSATEQEKLRAAVACDLSMEGPEEIWRTRTFRKNLIHSFGAIV